MSAMTRLVARQTLDAQWVRVQEETHEWYRREQELAAAFMRAVEAKIAADIVGRYRGNA